MLRTLSVAACAAGLCATADLSTDYRTDRILVVESTLEFQAEVTSFEVLLDGEPREGGGGGGEQTSTVTISTVHADHAVEAADGKASKVHREFRSLSASNTRGGGEANDLSSPLEGVTLELVEEDGEVSVSVPGGEDLEDAQLEGHQMTLAMDALLPDGEVEDGDSWNLDGDMIAAAIGFQQQGVLFTRPEREGRERGERGGGGGGGRRGGGGGQAGSLAEFRHLDWEGTASLGGTEDYEGTSCWMIELELEASGALPEQAGGGRRGRDRSASPAEPSYSLPVETTMEVEIKGRMLISTEDRRPVLLDLEGTFERETERTMERGERTIEMSGSSEGTFKLGVIVSEESPE